MEAVTRAGQCERRRRAVSSRRPCETSTRRCRDAAATDPPSNWREGPRRSFVDYGKPYDEEFPGMEPDELDAAICDDARFPGDLGYESRETSGRFS